MGYSLARWGEGEVEGAELTRAMLREVREPQGGGMGCDLGRSVKLTSTCQHLYTSAVQPWRQEDQEQLEIPIR